LTGLTAELVVDGRAPQTPALAPSGRLLSYVVASTSRIGDHLDSEVWLADVDGADARRATADATAEYRPRWSADSGTLYFRSDRAERGVPQVYGLAVGPPTGLLRKITDTRPELDGVTFDIQRPLAYRAADGLDLDGLLVPPVGTSASDSPLSARHDRARRPLRPVCRSPPVTGAESLSVEANRVRAGARICR
jgi:hypothetical protein